MSLLLDGHLGKMDTRVGPCLSLIHFTPDGRTLSVGGLGRIRVDFHCRNFFTSARTQILQIQAKYGKSCVNVKVEPRCTFTFRRGVSYIVSILFTDVKI